MFGCGACEDDRGARDTGGDAGTDLRICGPECEDGGRDAGPDLGEELCDGQNCVCRIGPDGGSCGTPYCSVTVDRGSLSSEKLFSVTEGTVVGERGAELLGRRVCEWETDARPNDLSREYEVAMRFDLDEIPAEFGPHEVAGVIVGEPPTLATAAVTDPERRRVTLGVTEPTPLGATVLPAAPVADAELGVSDFNPTDASAYLRNVSRYRFGAVFHDGQRLYAGNGPRLLVWQSGVPSTPAQPPDVVLGRPDLLSQTNETSASSFGGSVRAIWSDGQRLAVAEGNRVLIWQRVPDASFTPADIVLGQSSFSANERNQGGDVDADTLAEPSAIWSDGTRFAVADGTNNRVLLWNTFPAISGQSADIVVGQPDFDTNVPAAGETPLYQARGVYFDGTRLAATSTFACNCVQVVNGWPAANNAPRDYLLGSLRGGNRVTPSDFTRAATLTGYGVGGLAVHESHRLSVWRQFPPVETAAADFHLGKPDGSLGDVVGRISTASFASAATLGGVHATNDRLIVADGHRLLIWNTLPDASFTAADLVVGQPSAASNTAEIDYRGISERTLAHPASISQSGDVTAIADRGNNRVLLVRGTFDNPSSVVVLGQPSGTAFVEGEPSERALALPAGVFTDGMRLVVADSGNHRVLVWNTLPTANHAAADVVLGQPAFDVGLQNAGAADADGDGDLDAGPASLHFPSGVWADADSVFVADTYNHRVLAWEGPPVDGGDATRVIGQPDFESNDPNRGAGWFARTADSLARPTDVAGLADGRMAVVDSENNRVLIFGADPTAEVVLGQPDFVADVSPNWLGGFNIGWPYTDSAKSASAESLRWPYGLAVRDGALAVADTGNHRVVVYAAPYASGMAADAVYGQPSFDARSASPDGVSARSVNAAEGVAFDGDRVLVADTLNHRILGFESAAASADSVFGQTVFSRNGVNGSSQAFDTLNRPGGFMIVGDATWVADRGHHRAVAFENRKLNRVLGQHDRGGAQRHAGLEAAEGWTMSGPADLWTDGSRMIVADRENHRVLVWNSIPDDPTSPADVVLGQPSTTSTAPNAGGVVTASESSMLGPEGVLVDGDTLYVADSGNNRVLVFDGIPTKTGAPADRVLCQPDFVSNLPNGGTELPAPATCSTPTDMLVVDGQLYVADSLNHRVLRFDAGFESGAAASLVLGQPDFATRRPVGANERPDAATFSNPTRLAFDGRGLFVVDRGNHRVLIFDAMPTESGVPADRVLGQVSFDTSVVTDRIDSLEAPDGIWVLPGDYNRTTVWIADSGHDRLVRFQRVARRF